MKEKILAALKTAYAKLGLSDKAFDGVASLLEKTVTEEAQIATVIGGDDVKALLTAIQGQVDSLRNKLSDKEKELNDYKEKHPATEPPKQDPPKQQEDEPAWAKAIREQNEVIIARQKAEDALKASKELTARMEEKLKAAGCTNKGLLSATLKGLALQKDETEDAAVERLKGDYNALATSTFGEGVVPGVGTPAFPDAKTAVERKNAVLISQGLLPKQEKTQ